MRHALSSTEIKAKGYLGVSDGKDNEGGEYISIHLLSSLKGWKGEDVHLSSS